jgi:serine/threonine protein kinase
MQLRFIAGRYAEIANTRRVGGQGEVFQATDLHQGGRTVAVKLLPATADAIYRIYFERSTAANRKLNHPNIAALLDSGIDATAGSYYLVMNWIPDTLSTWLKGFEEPPGWDDLADSVALPLASALAHSHSLAVLHRDIKPANVLWDGAGPLLSDFALSKIKDQVAGVQDATTVGSTNAPWAPPDNSSRGSARFDVYGLAATLLQCVTSWPIKDFPDIKKALKSADIPREVLDVLSRALAQDPLDRQADGQVLLVELQAIRDARNSRWRKQKVVAFELSNTARRALAEAIPDQRPEFALPGLLGDATVALPRLNSGPDGKSYYSADEFRLVGDQLELGMVFTDQHRLFAKWAKVTDFEALERYRANEDAVPIDGRDFSWSADRPVNPRQSAMAANEIRTLLNKAVQDFGDRFSERFKQARLNNWSQLIDAKEQLEKKLEEPISYQIVGRKAAEFELEAPVPVPNAVLDQERVARSEDDPTARGVRVTVVDIDGTDFVVRALQDGRHMLSTGVLVRDRRPSQAAIKRQKTALAALREGSATRPHLRELVLEPEVAKTPEPVAFDPITPDLDQDKMVAVANALGAEDLYLVEGPPGTGKTSFICELVNQYLLARPKDKVLLVSQMHVAIDNAVIRLFKSGVSNVVRLSSRDDKVDPEASHLLLSSKLEAWTEAIAQRAQHGLSVLAEREGIKIDYVSLALKAGQARAALRDLAERREALGLIDQSDRLDNEELSDERATLLSDYYRAVERAEEATSAARYAAEELGEDISASPGDSELASLTDRLVGNRPGHQRLRELLRIQGDWLNSLSDHDASEPLFLPTQSVVAGTCMGFLSNSKVQEMQFDLCIIDEASRATASELLVPMTRAKRWVMVGDPKQLPPMAEEVFEHKDLVDEFELDKLFHGSSLFDILLNEAPGECRTRLTTQHRMAVPIGRLISDTFYDGELTNAPFPIFVADSVDDADRLVWFSTSRRSDRAEEPKHTRGESSSNKFEALEIAKLIARLEAATQDGQLRRIKGGPVSVLILTGYRAQCLEIERAIRRLNFNGVTVTVNTVDAVQGREADIVIFSVTRSNLTGDFGFLDERYSGRINVALSRAREILWIVGDSEFASSKEGPLRRALSHINRPGFGRIEYL